MVQFIPLNQKSLNLKIKKIVASNELPQYSADQLKNQMIPEITTNNHIDNLNLFDLNQYDFNFNEYYISTSQASLSKLIFFNKCLLFKLK